MTPIVHFKNLFRETDNYKKKSFVKVNVINSRTSKLAHSWTV